MTIWMNKSIKAGFKMQCCGSGMTYYRAGLVTYPFQVIPDPNPIPD
jgi:hypothetical protein